MPDECVACACRVSVLVLVFVEHACRVSVEYIGVCISRQLCVYAVCMSSECVGVCIVTYNCIQHIYTYPYTTRPTCTHINTLAYLHESWIFLLCRLCVWFVHIE